MGKFADSVKRYVGLSSGVSESEKYDSLDFIDSRHLGDHGSVLIANPEYNDIDRRTASLSYVDMAVMRSYENTKPNRLAPNIRNGIAYNVVDIANCVEYDVALDPTSYSDGDNSISIDSTDMYGGQPLAIAVMYDTDSKSAKLAYATKADVAFNKSGKNLFIEDVAIEPDKFHDLQGYEALVAANLANQQNEKSGSEVRFRTHIFDENGPWSDYPDPTDSSIKSNVWVCDIYHGGDFPGAIYFSDDIDPENDYSPYVSNLSFVDGQFDVKISTLFGDDNCPAPTVDEWFASYSPETQQAMVDYVSPFIQKYLEVGGKIDLMSTNEFTRRAYVDAYAHTTDEPIAIYDPNHEFKFAGDFQYSPDKKMFTVDMDLPNGYHLISDPMFTHTGKGVFSGLTDSTNLINQLMSPIAKHDAEFTRFEATTINPEFLSMLRDHEIMEELMDDVSMGTTNGSLFVGENNDKPLAGYGVHQPYNSNDNALRVGEATSLMLNYTIKGKEIRLINVSPAFDDATEQIKVISNKSLISSAVAADRELGTDGLPHFLKYNLSNPDNPEVIIVDANDHNYSEIQLHGDRISLGFNGDNFVAKIHEASGVREINADDVMYRDGMINDANKIVIDNAASTLVEKYTSIGGCPKDLSKCNVFTKNLYEDFGYTEQLYESRREMPDFGIRDRSDSSFDFEF